MLANPFNQLHLLEGSETCNGTLNYTSQRHFVDSDKAVIVHVRKETHDKLAIHTVGDPSMSWNTVPEILNLEGTFETGCEEPTKGGDERGESGEDQNVHLHWCHRESFETWEPDW